MQTINKLINNLQLQQEAQLTGQNHLQECDKNESQTQSQNLQKLKDEQQRQIEESKKKKSKILTELLLNDFAITWGAKWTSVVAECDYNRVAEIWGEEISSLTEDEFVLAMRTCRAIYNFPPSISEFLRAAYSFYTENESFRIASNHTQKELRGILGESIKDKILYNARQSVIGIFNTTNEYSIQDQKREWKKAYNNEIETFLKTRG